MKHLTIKNGLLAWLLVAFLLNVSCATPPPDSKIKQHGGIKYLGIGGDYYAEDEGDRIKQALSECKKNSEKTPQTVLGDHFTLNARVCVAYAGDGDRPINPWEPEDWETSQLKEGEIYFVAILKDVAAEMQKVTIQSDVLRDIIRSENYLHNYDLYHGQPTDVLDVYIGVFDDDGWPSDRTEKLKKVEQSLGTSLEAFPAAGPYFPLIQPLFDLIPALMEFVDPDDAIVSGRAFVTKQKIQDSDGTQQTKWTLLNHTIHNDNGKIVLTISPD